jgi:hypothetical protein
MSERGWRTILAAGAVAMLLSVPAQATTDCAPLSASFELCADGTPWAEARWISFGDGVALELGDYYLEFIEDWATRQDDDPLDTALDALLAEMNELDDELGIEAPELLRRDAFDSPPLIVARAVKDIAEQGDVPLLMAVMIAAAPEGRIAVMFGHDGEIDLDTLDREARSLIALVRPAEER